MANFEAIRMVGRRRLFFGAAALLALAGCKPVPLDEPVKKTDADYKPAITPTVQDIAVDRSQLLTAMANASSAAASGVDDSAAQNALDGRQFILKMPIGCGPQGKEPTGWNYDAASKRLVLRATPNIDLTGVREAGLLASEPGSEPASGQPRAAEATNAASLENVVRANMTTPATASDIEAVDGFWIPRPWLFTDSCPVVKRAQDAALDEPKPENAEPDDADETHPDAIIVTSLPLFGIAHFYTSQESRTGRRGGQAYTITRRITEGESFDPEGLRLVLRGRLGAAPGGKVIQCVVTEAGFQPRCIVSATFDRVSFENADGSIVYAQWGGA